jgi:putative methyltransferase
MKKNVYFLSFNEGIWHATMFVPVLWPSAKTYYEKYGHRTDEYNWVLPTVEFLSDIDAIKSEIAKAPPDIFGVSMYVWNYELTLEICSWVKETWPNCLVITGGPHQYFKHHNDWFIKHAFIDASLPSEVYGEIAIADILNNYQNGKVDWNKVEQMVYPSKNRKMILKSPKATYKLDFKWDYSPFKEQQALLTEYIDKFNNAHPDLTIHCKIETTRGCPYECTFCDWGGGVGTKLIKKDIELIKQDIDTLLSWTPASIYMCDSNFGINGDRDVDIIKYIAQKKKESKLAIFPHIQYGGFAKTNRHFDHLKQILTIEAENGLSYVYKISVQTFNQQVLDNIKRVDLRAEEHWELANYLQTNYGYEATVELIFGLPGATTDIWYHDFDVPYEKGVYVRAYEWHMLPEAEAYDDSYRKKFGLITAKKTTNGKWTIPSEIVVGSDSMPPKDYVETMVAYCCYNFFTQTSVYSNSIKQLLEKNSFKYGDFLKLFVHRCFSKMPVLDPLKNHLDEFVQGPNNINIVTKYHDGTELLIWVYMILAYFDNFEILDPIIQQFLIDNGCDASLVQDDSLMIINNARVGTTKRVGLRKIRYDNFPSRDILINDLHRVYQFGYTNLLVGRKTIL